MENCVYFFVDMSVSILDLLVWLGVGRREGGV